MDDFLAKIEEKNAQIDATIAKLERDDPRLTSLDLSHDEIRGQAVQERFVKSLKRNTNLTYLNISGTTWEKHGDFITAFTQNMSITKLIMDTKRARALHADVVRILEHYLQLNVTLKQALNGLTSVGLSCRSRKLRALPPFLFNSPNSAQITNLDVSHNKLSELPKDLTKLQSLLTSLPPEIGLLSSLTHLNVCTNRIATLPPSLGLLANLQALNVEENFLHKLPVTLGDCLKLQTLHLDKNQLVTIPPELLATLHSDPSQADLILGYLRNLQKGSKRAYNIKLMFVGNGNVGKTTLLRGLTGEVQITWMQRLAGNSGNQPPSISKSSPNISTDGIDIAEWEVHPTLTSDVLPMPDDRLKFNCWDFAGQEVYYTTHQFFLSHRSLYLVIFDMRHPEEEFSRIEYWLQSIISRTSNSPIVVIGTHSGDPMCTEQYVDNVLDEVEQRIRSIKCTKFVQAFAVVDSVQGAGLDTLREKLVGLALEQPYMGEEIPQNYMALQEKIKAIKETGKPTLSWDEFKALAIIDCGISEGDVVGATKFLQNLGVIVYFADEQLKNLVVIDPQFLVDIMATIFTTKNSFVKAGVLTHNSIPHIWREPRFPASIHNLLLSLLQRFEISFSLPKAPGEVGSSLFPSLLPKERPQTDFVWPDDVLWLADSTHVQHDRIFQLEFFPIGLFSRLMVRLLQITDALKYWRYGLILSNPDGRNGADTGGESASVELHPNDKMLRISVRGGKNPSKVLRMLVETFELLVSKWYNIKSFKRIIPCVHCLADKDNQDPSDGPYLFSLEDCEREASLGSSSMYCLKANIPIRLDQLVPDVVLSDLESRRIDFSLVHLEKELAKGGFGIVYKAKYNNQVVAVKKLIIEETEEGEEDNTASKVFGEFRREVWVMSGLKHPNIVQLLGFCINPLAMVMEFVPSGTLYDFLAKNKDEPLDWPMRLKCASDIAYGMLFLHTLNPPLMHRDFKSPNIMLSGTTPTSNIVCKVTDFGLSSQMWVDSLKEKSSERDIANPTWLAPEVINETEYTVKSDVYSYGIILWELLTRQHPFDEYKWSFMSQLEQLVTDGKRPTIPLDTIPEYAKLVSDCWHSDPKLRPHFSEICKVLDKLVEQHAPYIPIPAKNKNMNIAEAKQAQLISNAHDSAAQAKDGANKPTTKKMNATTYVKTLETPNSVWSICVHGNKVWTSHGIDPAVTPKSAAPSAPTSPTNGNYINPFLSPTTTPGRHTVSAPTSPESKLPPPPDTRGKAGLTVRTVSTSSNLNVKGQSGTNSPTASSYSLSKSGALSPPPFASSPSFSKSGNNSPTSASAPSSPPMLLRTQTSSLLRGFSSSLLTRGVSQMDIVKPPNFNEICIWDSESGQLVGAVPEAHPAIINSLLVVTDDVWSASEDGSIKSWNIQSWERTTEVANPLDNENKFSGFLMKKALNRFSQHWQRRWFVLNGTTLIRYKSQNSPEPKETIEIKGANVRSHKRKFCIAITVKSSSKRKNEGCEMLVSAQSQEEYDMWLEKLQAVTVDVNEKQSIELLKPDLVGDMVCGLGAVKCMAIVDGRVWTGTRGGICAFNIEEQRYTGAIKLSKSTFNAKGEDLENMYVNQIISHNKYVWCAAGPSIVRIDPRTRQMVDWFDGHTGMIDDMALFGDHLWSCSSTDHTMRVWNTNMNPIRSHAQAGPYSVRKLGSVFENYEGMSVCVIGNVIWIGGADGNIRVWDPQSKTVQKTLDKKHEADITSIAITNKTVWVTCADGTISVWLVN